MVRFFVSLVVLAAVAAYFGWASVRPEAAPVTTGTTAGRVGR